MSATMVEPDLFRRGLAMELRSRAERRRRSCDRDGPTGEDLKIIAMFERLAADAETLDPQAILLCSRVLARRAAARRFLRERELLFAQVGVTVAPRNAADLVRWMCGHVAEGDFARHLSGMPTAGADRAASPPAAPGVLAAVANDFCAGFGIMGPVLAIWEIGQGIGQWHDRSLAEAQPAVSATVIATKPVGGDRDARLASQAVLNFRPSPASVACQVSVRLPSDAARLEAGAVVAVVPRSPDCEPPLFPSEIGDPMVTFAFAAALLAGGLAALACWGRLSRRARPRGSHAARDPDWARSGTLTGRPR